MSYLGPVWREAVQGTSCLGGGEGSGYPNQVTYPLPQLSWHDKDRRVSDAS